MITCRAPGKLFVAGEYAVVEPGHPAVLMAVDRQAIATVADSDRGLSIRSDLLGKSVFRCERVGNAMSLPHADAAVRASLAYVLAAITIVEHLLIERGGRTRPFQLEIHTGDFADADGRKFGLGSSAAVTVAVVAAFAEFYRLSTSPMDRFRLAMLATVAVDPRCSGGDVAASTWGGWIAYASPDRHRLRALSTRGAIDLLLHSDWPGLSIRHLATPTTLHLEVGWTGEPAASGELVAQFTERQYSTGYFERFLEESTDSVNRLISALEVGDVVEVKHQVRRSRRILCGLDDAIALGIMTPALSRLCAVGEELGAAAKPSGAGGGDCGIAVIERGAKPEIELMRNRWSRAGIRSIPVQTYPATRESS
ncbi:phosphomevalonate kinase [Nocardia sp. CS682]|uniref:phosphomevalonate kinase n=1 Tax=Nocardia sp. CS682 TaxID=1047172 RepID=UPI0010755BD0|nr:phosphomevalonate kinase [Nocardia sp. CS682]QBS39523.1 phosphomevalonate kinase [Nocardia sp. CS682]